MAVFPQLSCQPAISGHKQGVLTDPVYRAEYGDGSALTRTRTTYVPRTLSLTYNIMPDADKEILEAWERDEIGYGGEKFDWWYKRAAKLYRAMLLGPIEYTLHPQNPDYWQVSFSLGLIQEL